MGNDSKFELILRIEPKRGLSHLSDCRISEFTIVAIRLYHTTIHYMIYPDLSPHIQLVLNLALAKQWRYLRYNVGRSPNRGVRMRDWEFINVKNTEGFYSTSLMIQKNRPSTRKISTCNYLNSRLNVTTWPLLSVAGGSPAQHTKRSLSSCSLLSSIIQFSRTQ